jgi:hypothetical protein
MECRHRLLAATKSDQKEIHHPEKQKPLGSVSATNVRYTAL